MSAFFRFLSRFWPSLIVVGVIFYATFAPHPLGDEKLPAIPNIDKIIHFTMMGGLVAAILFDIRREVHVAGNNRCRAHLSVRTICYVAIGVALFSVADEYVQGMLPNGRPSEFADGVANILGVISASFLAPPVLRRIFPEPR